MYNPQTLSLLHEIGMAIYLSCLPDPTRVDIAHGPDRLVYMDQIWSTNPDMLLGHVEIGSKPFKQLDHRKII